MAAITLEELLGKVSVHPEKLNDSISHDHLHAIASFLTSWCKVATYLGLSENDLDGVEQEGKDEQEKRIKALQKWKGKFGFKATYRMLVEVLLSLSKADVAENVCHLLRGMCSKHLVVHYSTCSKKLFSKGRNSLVPRPSLPPVFDHLQYCKRSKTGAGEGLGMKLGRRVAVSFRG